MKGALVFAVALACALVATESRAQDEEEGRNVDWDAVAMFGATGFDIVTTEVGLLSADVHERNALVKNRVVRIGWKLGSTLAAWKAAERLEAEGHPQGAKILRTLWISGHVAAGSWNIAMTIRWR